MIKIFLKCLYNYYWNMTLKFFNLHYLMNKSKLLNIIKIADWFFFIY